MNADLYRYDVMQSRRRLEPSARLVVVQAEYATLAGRHKSADQAKGTCVHRHSGLHL